MQAPMFDGFLFNPFALFYDGFSSSEATLLLWPLPYFKASRSKEIGQVDTQRRLKEKDGENNRSKKESQTHFLFFEG